MSRECPVCHHPVVERRIRHIQTRHDRVVVFGDVPAEVCGHCGEILFSGSVVDKLNSLLWSTAPATQTIEAPAYDLSAV